MKAWMLSLCFLTLNAFAQQDPATYLNLFDNKVYSLRTKGVKDFVVDISSTKLLEQINDEKTFGQVKQLTFRTYWTASPERISIEVIGLPEGFKEVKENLKASVLNVIDSLLPIPMAQRFPGYKLSSGTIAKEFVATDTTGIAPVPSYLVRFDGEDKLSEIVARKPVGEWTMKYTFDKKSFSDGRWVLINSVSVNSEGGQTLTTTKSHDYATASGMGVLNRVSMTIEQKSANPADKPVVFSEEVKFSNYKINTGDALKHFLGDAPKTP